jgi:tetratricopeptide (TPR) repeat protein
VAEDEAAWAPILHALGRNDEAERLLRHAIEVLEQTFGPKHPEVAGAWNNLAAVLQKRGDYAEADDAYGRALAAKELLLGREHPSVGITLPRDGARRRDRRARDEPRQHERVRR